jgi:ubiquinone/menaquinone biosynthesis C-methylase UbiE
MVDQKVRYTLIRDALPKAPARVCEVGVGGGWLLQNLQEAGYEVHGCDVNLAGLPLNSPLTDRVKLASGARLPYKDDDFDASFSCDVLEHVNPTDRPAFLAELVRVTKPGGVVVLTAFFHNTISFRLWGVGCLLLKGTLPSWYTEHLIIPLPDEKETRLCLEKSLTEVRTLRYQRTLNLMIMWLQCMTDSQPLLSRLCGCLRVFIPHFDLFGGTTSVFFTGTKTLSRSKT